MQYIAHKNEDGKTQSVKNHLLQTAALAESFAVPICKPLAHLTGLIHDIGKYSDLFQRRIRGEQVKVEHAICGAKELKHIADKLLFNEMMQFCVAGHHSGLPDGGSAADLPDLPTLNARMKRITQKYAAYQNEIDISKPRCEALTQVFEERVREGDLNEVIELYAFFTKYLFSCLADADFLDTECFFLGEIRGIAGDRNKAIDLLNQKMTNFKNDTQVKVARSALQAQAIGNIGHAKEINLLNMPTGSGKTLCSLKVALELLMRENKKRIVYVIPYQSIIEQTADVFEDILGDAIAVLRHCANYTFDQEEEEDPQTAQKLKKACENWDAELIVTTSVQFFESVYHYKGSKLRKLHNLADAVIVFDEIHLMPVTHMQPCIRAIGYITKYLNSKAVFLSATMPDFNRLFEQYIPHAEVAELVCDRSLFSVFATCSYHNLGQQSLEAIAQMVQKQQSSLIIVNSRKSARQMFALLGGKKHHLSTYMTPAHRSTVIEEIRKCLANGEKIAVASTSLVEAGVDFDFEAVFRQLTGLDSILQAGGRCNREGKRQEGRVYIFDSKESLAGDLQIRANIAADLLKQYEDPTTPACVAEYYRRLFSFHCETMDKNSIAQFCDGGVKSLPFRTYAQQFEYISSDTVGIIINHCDACDALLARLTLGEKSVLRKLQKYTVSVYHFECATLLKMGLLQEVQGAFVLADNKYYDAQTGLCIDQTFDDDYIV